MLSGNANLYSVIEAEYGCNNESDYRMQLLNSNCDLADFMEEFEKEDFHPLMRLINPEEPGKVVPLEHTCFIVFSSGTT